MVETGHGIGRVDLPTLNDNPDSPNPQNSFEWYEDGHSHGTHCVGTIRGRGTNSKGVVGGGG